MSSEAGTAVPTTTDPENPFAAWVCRSPHRRDPADAGPLVGVDVGVKDVIATAELPTRFGSWLPEACFSELLAAGDADCVRALRESGARIAGKTVTAELATYKPGPTVNPLDRAHTPGGSSSGSAAAVSAGDVPLALATQTAGSVIRPASFCGVLGFKPTFGRYSTRGVLATAPSLDTLGLIAAEPSFLAAADAVLAATGEREEPLANARRLVLYRTASWTDANAATRAIVEAQFERWRPRFAESEIREPREDIETLREVQRIIHCGEVAEQLGWLAEKYPDAVSDAFKTMVREGRAVAGPALSAARDTLRRARERVEVLFPGDEIWLTPAARGPAPLLSEGTGDPLFCRAWTALGIPCATLPGRSRPGTLPTGVQLLASTGRDRLLLAVLASLADPTEPSQGREINA